MPDGLSQHNCVSDFLLGKVRQILGVNIGAVCRETEYRQLRACVCASAQTGTGDPCNFR